MPISATDVSFAYDPAHPVLSGVWISLAPGQITAIVGPNGAGKSTLIRLLLGILKPTSGRVLLDDTPVASIPHRQRARRIAYVPQRPSIAFAFTVREYVGLGRYAAGESPAAPAVSAALDRVQLADRADDPFPILSIGQQQRAALARALAQLDRRAEPDRPLVLLADEPVSAMDPRYALQTMAILRDLADSGRSRTAVAVVLHDLTLARRFCDAAIVLDQRGRPAAAGPIGATLVPPVLDAVFAVRFDLIGDRSESSALIPALPGPEH